MKNQLSPHRYQTYNCIENCIANVCDATNIDSRPLFIHSWDFGYGNLCKTIGEKIHYHYSCSMGMEDFIEISNYLNIVIEHEMLDRKDIKYKCANGSIYIVEADSYDCPWNSAFQKYHHPHYYLLGSNEKGYYVVDSFCTSDVIQIEESILSHAKQFYIIEPQKEENRDFKKQSIKNEFFRFIQSNQEKGLYSTIHRFAEDLTKTTSVDMLTPQYCDISDTHIIRRLSYISNSRYNTVLLMSYLELDDTWIHHMKDIYAKWDSLKNFFIKMLISKRVSMMSQASEVISLIAKDECKLAQTIIGEIYQ